MSTTIADWLDQNTNKLIQSGVSTARLDCLVLLEDCLQTNRANLLAHTDKNLSEEQLEKLNYQINQRQTHQPLAYIRGKTEFYGRDFIIRPTVLEPRPESETLIDELKKLNLKQPRIADIGTGSGALGVTAALELKTNTVDLIDISSDALDVAKQNLAHHHLQLNCYLSDLLSETPANLKYSVLLCNLPYVPDSFKINQAALNEPKLAIFGGIDGLDLYRRLFQQANDLSDSAPTYILTEALPPQHNQLQAIAETLNYHLVSTNDFIQVFKLAR